MKVFLGNSPWTKKGYYGVRAGSRWPHFEHDHYEYMPFPFFLAYAAAVLEENDHEVLLVDGVAEISQKMNSSTDSPLLLPNLLSLRSLLFQLMLIWQLLKK